MTPRVTARRSPCEVCGAVVGTYEPAVFVLGDEIVHASRAAQPDLIDQPGCRLLHDGCYDAGGSPV